jgi:uncharacterized protein YndB with AHSA1/START domain
MFTTSIPGTKDAGIGATRTTLPSDREIRTERVFDSPRQAVWRAHTDPELLARWWGRGNPLDIEAFELRRDGRWRFVERGPEGAMSFSGVFLEVRPPSRIVQTFGWAGMPGHEIVTTLTLEPIGDEQTKVTSTMFFHDSKERDVMLHSGMEDGLNESYAALDRILDEVT